jgi:hypothetical protein
LARIRLQVLRDLHQEHRPQLSKFLLPHAADSGQLAFAGRIITRHLAQRDIREQDVRRDISFISQPLAQLRQPLEEDFVAGNFANPLDLRLRRADGSGEPDRRSLFERGQALWRQRQHIKFIGELFHEPKSHQLAADRLPFRPAVFLSDAIRGKLLVLPFPHALGLRPRQHLDDLVDAEVEPALPADAVNAGKEFLGRQRAVVSVAWGKTIIAAAAAFGRELLTEVSQQLLAPAGRALGVVDHLLQLGVGDLSFFRTRFLIDEPQLLDHITGAE